MTLLISIVMIALNGLFVAFEFALLASLRSRLVGDGVELGLGARSAVAAMSRIGVMLTGAQLGITLTSLVLGAVAEPAIAHRLEPIADDLGLPSATAHTVALIIALTIVVFAHMVGGEMVPKNVALAAPERTLVVLAPPMSAFVWLLRPLIHGLNATGNAGAKLLGVEPTDELSSAANAAAFEVMLGESRAGGHLEDEEHELLIGALAFRERTARDVMVPLERVSALGYRAAISEFEELIRSSGHSRIVVTGASPLDLVGFVHAKDLLRMAADRRDSPIPLTLCRPTFAVPDGRPLGDVLLEMRRSRRHVAWVNGTDGTVVGMVTMEDILEQIVGDIVDETDRVAR